MEEETEFVWRARRIVAWPHIGLVSVESVCAEGIGYISFSDTRGRGFTIWLKREAVFQGIRRALIRAEWNEFTQSGEKKCGLGERKANAKR